MSSKYIIETRNLSYAYPGSEEIPGQRSTAIKSINFNLKRGIKLALLGANGAGKTTLMLHLNGILRPQNGRLLIDGEEADYSRKGLAKLRQKVGMVFQDPDDQLFASTVFQDVSFGPLNLGLTEKEARERVEEALTTMKISELAESPTHRLSFGQKKRAAIAGVLAMKPELIVLDEPSAGLDPEGTEQLFNELDKLNANGTTIIVSTHEVEHAYFRTNEVAVMSHGELLAQGQAQTVMGNEELMRTASLKVPWVLKLYKLVSGLAPSDERYDAPKTQDAAFDFFKSKITK